MQRSTARIIPAAHIFHHVMRAAYITDGRPAAEAFAEPLRWSAVALTALHEAAEAFLVELFEESVYLQIHARRVTLLPKDMRLARYIRIHAGQPILLRHVPLKSTEDIEEEARWPLVRRREWNDAAHPNKRVCLERGFDGYGEPGKHFQTKAYEP